MSTGERTTDFEGICKWKLIVPLCYIASWALMIVGPLKFPYPYQIYCFVITAYSLLKTLGIILSIIYAIYRLKKTTKRWHSPPIEPQLPPFQIYHAVIIPSYKEDEELLIQTLGVLAENPKAPASMIVMLAMESHEEGASQKANRIINRMQDKFLKVEFTLHTLREGEAKGKASNVSWCVQYMMDKLENLSLSQQDILLTIMDADSWGPPQYFFELQSMIYQNPESKHETMFCPPQIFTRNHLQVPVFNRIYDNMHSLVHISSMVALKYSFPLSNYSLGLKLAKRIGYWDTCSDAIGEDFHTCQKCHWKSDGPFYTRSVYIPFNQLSLETGQGYLKNIKARFVQALRHTRGVADAAYCLNMLFKTRFRLRNLFLTVLVLQVYLVAAIVPWALFSLGIMYKIVPDITLRFFPMWVIDVILNSTGGLTLIGFIFYQVFRRISNTAIYKQKNDPIWHLIFYPLCMIIALFGYSLPSFVIASFTSICTAPDYQVAEKKQSSPDKSPPPETEKQLNNNKDKDKELTGNYDHIFPTDANLQSQRDLYYSKPSNSKQSSSEEEKKSTMPSRPGNNYNNSSDNNNNNRKKER